MKTHIFSICTLVAGLFFISCEQNTPTPIIIPDGGNTPPKETVAYFEYSMIGFYSLNIKDKSTGKEVIYDFGDGTIEKYNLPYNYLIYHGYTKLGTFTISAQVTGYDGTIKTYSQSVTIRDPKIYISGIKYISVDNDLEYYKAKLVDDDFFTTTWFTTNYTPILSKSSLPYTYTFNKAIEMNGLSEDDYYTLYIYHNTKNSGDGTQCLKQNISTPVFNAQLPYIEVKNNSGNTVVQLLMEYK